ncbi:MAG: protein kinase [bacterium]
MLDEKYEIVREIKKGGFGIVYYGMDRKLNKPVAIKEIAPNLLDDPKYLDMFQEEALNIAKLSHNNIVHIYELKKTTDRHLYIIMEYIDGIDLEKINRHARKYNQKMPAHLGIYIVSEICMALEYAHQRRDAFTNKPLNLVHQDISPSNIMISRYGAVKLIDFGIASVRRHHKAKKDSKLRGKIPYMAPEQLIMGNHPDHRSDLFSLGLVLFEAITGERLFTSQEEVIAAGKNPKWFKKALKGKRLPHALVKILLRALEIDLSKRYQSANHMYIDLLQYLIASNETGELMDDLAAHLADQFTVQTPPITPPNYSTTTPEKLESSPLTSQDPGLASSVNWQMANPTPVLPPEARLQPKHASPSYPDRTRPAQQQFPTDFSTMEFEGEGEEDLKTVIDVLRISARNNKKRIVQACIGLMIAVAGFLALDTMNHWTRAGLWLYDVVFPPAIEITTVPENATLFLDDKKVAGTTPLAIDEIAPGVHKLELSLAGYKPIVKSLFVPREGDIRVQGEAEGDRNQTYLFRFTTEVEIASEPPGAQVYINGIRLNQRTPCAITWEVGHPLAIELERSGFEKLAEYSLDTISGLDEVDDRRLWELIVYNDTYRKYAITGIFRKRVFIESVPSGVEIVDRKTGQMIGMAGNRDGLLLPMGRHKLEMRKDNFISKTLTVVVDEASSERVNVVLSRSVRFSARDSSTRERGDIGATLISIRHNNRDLGRGGKQTPFKIVLPAYSLTAIFSKPGYERKQIRVGGAAHSVVVEMPPLKTMVEISVRDALTEVPIPGADIYYTATEPIRSKETFLDQTDVNGEGIGRLPAGNYVLKVKKAGYNELSRTVIARAGDTTNLVFEIFPSN